MIDHGKHFEHIGNGMRVAIILFLGALGLITIINLASGAEAAPWWFYVLALAVSYGFWRLASFFIHSRD